MSLLPFSSLPPSSRLWAFAAPRQLDDEEQNHLEESVREFLSGWAAHGAALTAGVEIREGRFLLVGVDQDQTAPSGCSIDAMVRFLKEYGEKTDIDLVDAPTCCRRVGDTIVCESRESFGSLVEGGEIDGESVVFDLTVPTVGDVRSGNFERSFAGSWYERAFAPATAS